MSETSNNIVIYQAADGEVSLDLHLENDSIWLNQKQIATIFGIQRPAVTKHLINIFQTNELDEKSVCSILELTASDDKKYSTKFYNLDAILSVGYRVNSKKATQFRIWANQVLKEYLIKGYAIKQQIQSEQLIDLKQTVRLLSNVIEHKDLSANEATGLLKVITDYAYGLDILDKYDYQQLQIENTSSKEYFRIGYEEAIKTIDFLRIKYGGSSLFGNEKDQSFKSSISTIYQTFDGEELYKSIEEKAANLLYLVVKNHSFSDGNKRIAAFIFLWFLEKNQLLYYSDGTKRIADNALVALTLMIAESKTEEKETMTKVVVNLINKKN